MHGENKKLSEGQIKKHWSRYELEVDSDTFGGRLYNKIVEKYGCRYYFEQATGLARETIKSYCLNKRHPSTVILEMLCRTLDVSADYLLFGEKRDRK